MKVFVIGGTGFLGTFLIPKLRDNGYEITMLTRNEKRISHLESLGIDVMVGDLLRPAPILARTPAQDVILSIAMPEVEIGRLSRKKLKTLQEKTKTFFSTPIAMAEKLHCPLIVTLGTSFATEGGEIADENWPIERIGMARVGEYVDPLLSQVLERGSPPLIQLLPGQIYGPGGLFKKFMHDWMKKGKYRVVGSGENHIPRIHVEDCAEAYIRVLEKMPLGERFIVADDGPCTTREFADCMAENMNVPRPKSVPGFVIRCVLGKLLYETVTMNCQVSNAKAKERLGWHLKYPTYREGLPATIRKLKDPEIHPVDSSAFP